MSKELGMEDTFEPRSINSLRNDDVDENNLIFIPNNFFDENSDEPQIETISETTSVLSKENNIIRNKYLSKLTYSKVWGPGQSEVSRQKGLTIFDWDDTLFPTSAFAPKSEY